MHKQNWYEFWSMGIIAITITAAMIGGIFLGVSLAIDVAEHEFEKMIVEHQMKAIPEVPEVFISECVVTPDVIIEREDDPS